MGRKESTAQKNEIEGYAQDLFSTSPLITLIQLFWADFFEESWSAAALGCEFLYLGGMAAYSNTESSIFTFVSMFESFSSDSPCGLLILITRGSLSPLVSLYSVK